MAVTYRLIGGNVDVFLDTDATRNSKEFFITDIRGEDSIDVQNGFQVGIEQYNEGTLAQFAMDHNTELYSFDEQRRERCVVRRPPNNAGRFNGTSSNLFFTPGFTLASGGDPQYTIEIALTFRVTQADFDLLRMTSRTYLFTTDTGQRDFLTILIEAIGRNRMRVTATSNFGISRLEAEVLINDPTDRCLDLRMQLISYLGGYYVNLVVDGVSDNSGIFPGNDNVPIDTFVFNYGSIYNSVETPDRAAFFSGVMRNLTASVAGTEVLNVVNPATGSNSVGADGTATDITGVSIIM